MNRLTRSEAAEASMFEILDQKKFWRSRSGGYVSTDVMRRKDMSLEHKVNTLAWLIRSAQSIVNSAMDLGSGFPFSIDMPDEVMDEIGRMQADALGWLFRQPFVRALLFDLVDAAEIGPEDLGMELMQGIPQPAYGGFWVAERDW